MLAIYPGGGLPTSISTFADVQAVLNAGKEIEKLSVGMEMDEIMVGGEPMVWVIGNITSGEVIFVPKWCLSTTRQMNSTNTNVGGWNSSALRTWLNGDFYNSLPDTVKPYIKSRTFKTSAGNQSTSLQSVTDKIWLPREYEVFGATTYAAATEHTDGDAEQFSIFTTSTNRVKTQGKTGSAYIWWESSPSINYAADFCSVTSAGAASQFGTSNTFGVLPCFRMTPDSGVELVDINPEKNTNISQGMPGCKYMPTRNGTQYDAIPIYGYKTLNLYWTAYSGVSMTYSFVDTNGNVSSDVNLPSNNWTSDIDIPSNAVALRLGITYTGNGSREVYYSLRA